MRKFVISLLVAVALVMAIAPASAQDTTIVSTAASIDDFSTLVAAVQAAGLVDTLNGPGPFTVLAPTNGAFNTLLSDLGVSAGDLLANTDLLTTVLLYHVVPGEVAAADIVAAGSLTATTAGGEALAVAFDGSDNRVKFNNGAAAVVTPDIRTGNGIIHVIDNVLLPPSVTGATIAAPAPAEAAPAASTAPTIVGTAASISDFSTLVAAVQAAGLVDTLNGPGPFTVLAPTNGAFNTLLSDLGVSAEELLANEALLTQVLLYHVIPGEVAAADIVAAGSLTATTANGASLAVAFDGSDNRVKFNGGAAAVVTPDIRTSNGIIHVIDNVLLPPQ